jgi:Heavy-metal resistance protein CzcE
VPDFTEKPDLARLSFWLRRFSMKLSRQKGGLALGLASALAVAGCATDYYEGSSTYGTPVSLRNTVVPAREVVVERVPAPVGERAPAREVVVERAPARDIVVGSAPAREVIVERVPADRVVVERYVERVPESGPGRAVTPDGMVVTYDREIVLGPSTRSVTVRRDEVVRFVVGDTGRSFVWRFNTPQENVSFPLATIAPSHISTNPAVMVHVVGPSVLGRSG